MGDGPAFPFLSFIHAYPFFYLVVECISFALGCIFHCSSMQIPIARSIMSTFSSPFPSIPLHSLILLSFCPLSLLTILFFIFKTHSSFTRQKYLKTLPFQYTMHPSLSISCPLFQISHHFTSSFLFVLSSSLHFFFPIVLVRESV